MHVLYLTTHLNAGGITSYLFTLISGLVKEGHKVTVVSSGGELEEKFRSAGADVINLNIKTKSDISPKLWFNFSKLKSIIKNKNIDIIHSQTRVMQVLASALSRRMNCPHVSTCHGFFKPKWNRIMFPCWGNKVIAISPAVKNHLLDDLNVADTKIKMVMSGIDLSVFNDMAEEDIKKNKEKYHITGKPVVGVVGRLSDVKGQDILLKALPDVVRRFPHLQVCLVGEGKLRSLLDQYVLQFGLASNVSFVSVVDKTAEIIPLFDVIVNPSRQEGLGISIMEAQACGRAVIASNVGGIPSLIKDQETGFLSEKENPEDLSRVLIEVLSREGLALKVGRQAKAYAQSNYSHLKMINETMQVYKEVLAQRIS